MAGVTLENMTKRFRGKEGEVCAVDDVSLTIEDREFLVLVGPSGCGKTTTLRLVAGLDPVTSGTIKIGDRVVNNVAPKDRDIAMVFQNYALYPHMTVFKNMAFGLKMRRVPKDEIRQKVAEVAEMLGIASLLQRKPAALSGGERQRVALGRAIVRRPQVFLFDEPLSNLDARLRVQMRTELKSLHHELKTTIIYVTHDQEEAMTLGDRVVVMKGGAIQQCGAPLDVYRRPQTRFVGGFMGSPPMNFLEGRLETSGHSVAFVHAIGRLELSSSLSESLEHASGQCVTLGVRPEHIALAGGQTVQPSHSVHAEAFAPLGEMSVHVVEPLGDCINVHLLEPPGSRVTARVSPTASLSPGQRVKVRVNVSHAHVYDTQSGQRLN